MSGPTRSTPTTMTGQIAISGPTIAWTAADVETPPTGTATPMAVTLINRAGRAGPTTIGPDSLGLRLAVQHQTVVLDGGLATQLERQGHDLSSALWSARLLADDPQAIEDAHAAFFAAGAQVATTASYQASVSGFARAGIDRSDAEKLIRRSVDIAARARSHSTGPTWIAGSVGPYGASLADGSEYRGDGNQTVGELREWHRPRIAQLVDAGADVLALETIPGAAEVEALLAEVDGSGVDCWLSVTCAGDRTRAGEPAAEVFAMARGVAEVIAVGVNCTDPADASALVGVAATASDKPVVVYPNSGETWDAVARRWTGTAAFTSDSVRGWVRDGARLIGGCCRVAPEEIAEIARQLSHV